MNVAELARGQRTLVQFVILKKELPSLRGLLVLKPILQR